MKATAAPLPRTGVLRLKLPQRSRCVKANFQKELRPAHYDTWQSTMHNMFEALKSGDSDACTSMLADDFMLTACNRPTTQPSNKEAFCKVCAAMPSRMKNLRLVATAVGALESSPPELGLSELPSGFALMEMEEAEGGDRMGAPLQMMGRVIIDQDGRVKLVERFRPLMGEEPDTLLKDPAAYRQRVATELPRLSVRPAEGNGEHMREVVQLICRDIFNPGSHTSDSLEHMTDDVVVFDGAGDAVCWDEPAEAVVYKGKDRVREFAEGFARSTVGEQRMMAVAASEDTNTAFAHFACLMMGNASWGWSILASRGMICCTFDDACEKVNAVSLMHTINPSERELMYKTGYQA